MLDLSTIIDAVLTGKAKLHYFADNYAAGAGAAIDEDFFVCPANTLRLIIGGYITAAKTTATLLQIASRNKGTNREYLFSRAVGTDNVAFPTSDGADKDELERSNHLPIFMQYGDRLHIYHALTAAETISDDVLFTYIEWQMGKEEMKDLYPSRIVFHAPPTM